MHLLIIENIDLKTTAVTALNPETCPNTRLPKPMAKSTHVRKALTSLRVSHEEDEANLCLASKMRETRWV